MTEPPEVGATVSLPSSLQKMTVLDTGQNTGLVFCAWVDEEGYHRLAYYPFTVLVGVDQVDHDGFRDSDG